MVRIGIAFLNFIVSFAISQVIFYSLRVLIPPEQTINYVTAYGVYKSPVINNIQNNEKTQKSDNKLTRFKKIR